MPVGNSLGQAMAESKLRSHVVSGVESIADLQLLGVLGLQHAILWVNDAGVHLLGHVDLVAPAGESKREAAGRTRIAEQEICGSISLFLSRHEHNQQGGNIFSPVDAFLVTGNISRLIIVNGIAVAAVVGVTPSSAVTREEQWVGGPSNC